MTVTEVKKDKVQKQSRRPKVKGKTYARVNLVVTRARENCADVAACSKCAREDDKRIKICETCANIYGGPSIVPCVASKKKVCPRNVAVSMCHFHYKRMEA